MAMNVRNEKSDYTSGSPDQAGASGAYSSSAIALANKLARIAWATMAKGECYKEPVALAA
jgi:hypothetical protein